MCNYNINLSKKEYKTQRVNLLFVKKFQSKVINHQIFVPKNCHCDQNKAP